MREGRDKKKERERARERERERERDRENDGGGKEEGGRASSALFKTSTQPRRVENKYINLDMLAL